MRVRANGRWIESGDRSVPRSASAEDLGLPRYDPGPGEPVLTAHDDVREFRFENGLLRADDRQTGAKLWEKSVGPGVRNANEPLSLLASAGSIYLTFFGAFVLPCD